MNVPAASGMLLSNRIRGNPDSHGVGGLTLAAIKFRECSCGDECLAVSDM